MTTRKLRTTLRYEQHDEIGKLMTLEDFVDACKAKVLINSDGHGYYATEHRITNILVDCSEIAQGKHLTMFTHVMWYNK